MKRFLSVFACWALASVLPAQTTDVLFVGNSYTFYNNLPQLLSNLALAGGDTVVTDQHTPGGYTFQLHSQNATTLSKINQQNWDVVILQGQSQEPALDTPYVVQNVLPYAHLLDSLIHLNDSCTRTLFYMTWGRKFGDAQNCAAYPPVCTYAGMQQQLRNRYLLMAAQNDAAAAPVGIAWQNVLATNPTFDLYDTDGSHPSLHGSYLAACVFYASIFGQSPAGLAYYGGLPMADAQLLQTVAGSTVLDSLWVWRTEAGLAVATSIQASATTATTSTFTLQTNFFDNCSWNFGDNTGWQTGNNVITHTFPTSGTYLVTGVVNNSCFTDTVTLSITLITNIAEVTNQQAIQVFPNPATDVVWLQVPTAEITTVELFDITGRNVYAAQHTPDASGRIVLDNLTAGSFLIRVRQGNQVMHTRLISTGAATR